MPHERLRLPPATQSQYPCKKQRDNTQPSAEKRVGEYGPRLGEQRAWVELEVVGDHVEFEQSNRDKCDDIRHDNELGKRNSVRKDPAYNIVSI